MKVLEANPTASPTEVIQRVSGVIDRERAGHSWQIIAIDERLVSFLAVAEPHIEAVRDFLDAPDSYLEGEFLQKAAVEGELESSHLPE